MPRFASNDSAEAAYKRAYYQANREKVLAQRRAYYQANKERIIRRDREYAIRNAEAISVYQRKYRELYGAEINAERRAERRADPVTYMLRHAKRSAKVKGIPFALKHEDVILPKVCPVLGIPLVVGNGFRTAASPSLDRIIPELGYVKGNVCVISWRANDLKRDATAAELRAVLQYVEVFGRGY